VHPFAGRDHLVDEVGPETLDDVIDGWGHFREVVLGDEPAHLIQSLVAFNVHESIHPLLHVSETQKILNRSETRADFSALRGIED
jgi:hypothetical protein